MRTMGGSRAALTVDDLRDRARHRLPRMVFEFVDGGAEDEVTLRANREAFAELSFRPRVLVDVEHRPLGVTVLGQPLSMPVILAPTGLMRMVHPDGELAAAVAAYRSGVVSVVSSGSSVSLEDVAQAAGAPQWFQLYPWGDRVAVDRLVRRAKDAGYTVLVVTADVPVLGSRERDLRNGLTVPPRVSPRTGWDVLSHPRWLAGLVTHAKPGFANFGEIEAGGRGTSGLARYTSGLLNPGHTWADLEWMVRAWDGPVVLKGVMSGPDARRATDAGCQGVVVSNHGGRQGDGVPASLEVLEEVVAEVGDQVDVLLDGGVRRGGDVVKALSLGARACLVGRPWVYGLAVGGTAGVSRVLEILREEMDRTLALIGRPGVEALDRTAVSARGSGPTPAPARHVTSPSLGP